MTLLRSMQKPLETVVFDLDDTLYLEHSYVLSGFRHIARITSESAGTPPDQIWEFLRMTAEDWRCRGKNLTLLRDEFPRIAAAWSLDDLVREYRGHPPDIALLEGVAPLLAELRACGLHLALITDGWPEAQRGKIQALSLATRVDEILITDDFGIDRRKPAPFAFQQISARFVCAAESCVYVGDNPVKDFVAPRSLGWSTIRLRMPAQLHETAEPLTLAAAADTECMSIQQLRQSLRALSCPAEAAIKMNLAATSIEL